MFKKMIGIVTIAGLVLALAPAAQATFIVTDSSPGTGYKNDGAFFVFGIEFTVGDSDMSVTALGFTDAGLDGLISSHEVGIWNVGADNGRLDKELIASVTVPLGTGTTISGGYRYVDLGTPVTLKSGEVYQLGANCGAGDGDKYRTTGIHSLDSAVTHTAGAEPYRENQGFGYMTNKYDAILKNTVANAEFTLVPEPATMALLAFGGLGLLRRKRR